MRFQHSKSCVELLASYVFVAGIFAGDCKSPLDNETIGVLTLEAPRSAVPGATVQLYFGKLECCYFVIATQACVVWSVEPPGAAEFTPPPIPDEPPGRFDIAMPGELRLSPTLSHGDTITVTASVESGRRLLSTVIHVYTPENNPFVGYWRESLELTCSGFIRGDADQSGGLLLTDAVVIFGYLFLGADDPTCMEALDSNADDNIDLSDGVYTLNHLFAGGPAPPVPYPSCGASPGPSALSCKSSRSCPETRVDPEMVLNELNFEADGTFSATWFPFEVYKDYWGTYTYDLSSQALSLNVEGGNYVPPDFRSLGGTFSFEEKKLVLRGIWLGTPPGSVDMLTRCGHVFE